jgi:hypothetical protein
MRILGRVDAVGRVVPLFEVTESEWRPIDLAEFPKEGRVYWPDPDGPEGALIFFTPQPNRGGNRRGWKDNFQATEHHLATEVIDLRAFHSVEGARRAIEDGNVPRGPTGSSVMLWCGDGLLVGPLKVRGEKGGLNLVPEGLARVPLFKDGEIHPREVQDDRGKARLVLEGPPVSAPTAYADWDTDEAVVRRALRVVGEAAAADGRDLGLTEEVISYTAKLVAALGTSTERSLDRYQLTRALNLLIDTELLREHAKKVAVAVSTNPTVAQAIITTGVRRSMELKLRGEFHDEEERIGAAKRELASVTDQTSVANAELERRRAELRGVEADVGRRVRQILEQPAALLAEVALIRAVVPAVVAPTPATPLAIAVPTPVTHSKRPRTHASKWQGASRQITEPAQLRQALIASFKARGVAPVSAIRIHAALVAGLMPIVTGPCAAAALEAYADAAFGGRRLLIHVSPAMLESTDLFGRLEGERFVPHAAGLIDAVEAAKESGESGVVILEGINRAPTESFLAPLMDVVTRGGAISIFHPDAVASSIIEPRIRWPANLRLAGTAIEGPTSLPICRDLLANAVVVETSPGESTTTSPTERTEVAASSELMRLGTPSRDLVTELLELPEAGDARNALERFSAALSRFESKPETVRSCMIEHVLLPFVVTLSNEGEREEATQAILANIDAADKDRVGSLARRLRRRLA